MQHGVTETELKMAVKEAKVVLLYLVAFTFSSVAGTIIHVNKCPEETQAYGTVVSVDITPCPTEPCVFKKGSVVNGTITFKSQEQITNDSLIKVYGKLPSLPWLPFPLDQPKACTGHGLECPLKPNVEYKTLISFEIKDAYPSTQLIAKMEMLDQNGKYVFCFEFPARIASSSEIIVSN